MEDRAEQLPDTRLPVDFRYADATPVLFGYYWMETEPIITNPTAACLDFSVARQGFITAYGWSGERELSAENLIRVPAEEQQALA
jgi:hypothetical protein